MDYVTHSDVYAQMSSQIYYIDGLYESGADFSRDVVNGDVCAYACVCVRWILHHNLWGNALKRKKQKKKRVIFLLVCTSWHECAEMNHP